MNYLYVVTAEIATNKRGKVANRKFNEKLTELKEANSLEAVGAKSFDTLATAKAACADNQLLALVSVDENEKIHVERAQLGSNAEKLSEKGSVPYDNSKFNDNKRYRDIMTPKSLDDNGLGRVIDLCNFYLNKMSPRLHHKERVTLLAQTILGKTGAENGMRPSIADVVSFIEALKSEVLQGESKVNLNGHYNQLLECASTCLKHNANMEAQSIDMRADLTKFTDGLAKLVAGPEMRVAQRQVEQPASAAAQATFFGSQRLHRLVHRSKQPAEKEPVVTKNKGMEMLTGEMEHALNQRSFRPGSSPASGS